jgi:hypothetical protein
VSYLLGNVVGVMTESAAEAASFSHPTSLGNITKILTFFIARGVGVKQLGFNFQFITTFIIVVVGVLSFGMALTFGIDSNALVANIIAAKQSKSHFRLNQYLKFSGIEGTWLK